MDKPKLIPVNQIKECKHIEIEEINVRKLFLRFFNMQELCSEEGGVGLHAAQIGEEENIFVVKKENGFAYFLNCCYKPIEDSNLIESVEGCLSIRKENGDLRLFKLQRYDKVRVIGKQLLDYEIVDVDFVEEGPYAFIFQHEIDHGDGKLISDLGEEIYIW
jgi:peptide deformylase